MESGSEQHSVDYRALREAMVQEQIAARGIQNPAILDAMGTVPRHLFVPPGNRDEAYSDFPIPIGLGQTISQPYIVALMTELAQPAPGSRVLDIGTGSGYQAAVLAAMGCEVHSIELIPDLAATAERRIHGLGYDVHVHIGDGSLGLPDHAPFDAIIVAAAPEHIPSALEHQLAPSGRLVIPLGDSSRQVLRVVTRQDGLLLPTDIIPVRFVPLIAREKN